MKKSLSMMLLVAMLLTSLAGCQQAQTASTAQSAASSAGATASSESGLKKDTLNVVGETLTETLDPITRNGNIDRFVKAALYDYLVRFGDDAEVIPCLAESWTDLDDNLTVEFKLREDVKFHDGSDFTADDVIYSIDLVMSDETMTTTYETYIADYKKVDDYTVQITRPASYVDLVGFLTLQIPIVPKAVYAADPEGFGANPVGTGAYKFVSQEADGSVKMVANGDYFLGVPDIENLVIKTPLDSSTAIVALETGEVDLIFNVPTAMLSTLEKNDSIETITETTFSSIVLNIYKLSNADLNLRKAIYHGINRQNAIAIATDGLSEESTNILSTKAMGAYAGAVEYVGYDEALAKEYLEQSSYVPGTPLVLSCNAAYALAAQSVQADLAKIGITVEIEQLDMNTWRSKLIKGELEMGISNFGTYGFGPVTVLQYLLPTNVSFGKNMDSSPEFEEVMAKLEKATDAAEIDELIVEGLTLRDDLDTLFSLYDLTSTLAYSKEITNISNTAAIVNGACYFGDIKAA